MVCRVWRDTLGHPVCHFWGGTVYTQHRPHSGESRMLLCSRKDFRSSGTKQLELVQMHRPTASSQHTRFLLLCLLVSMLLSCPCLSLFVSLMERCQEQLDFLRLSVSQVSAVLAGCPWHSLTTAAVVQPRGLGQAAQAHQHQTVKVEEDRKWGASVADRMCEACCTGFYFVFKPCVLPPPWQWLSSTVVER